MHNKVNNIIIWEAAVLVLLMGVIAVEMASDGMMYISSFMKIGSGIQVIFRLLLWQGSSVGITNGKDLWCLPLN
jgi:hypothetical protein